MKIFKTELGFVEYDNVSINYRYEFIDVGINEYKIWDKRKNWYYINMIRVHEKFNGNGKKLLKDFICHLSINFGLILNAVSIDDDMSDIQKWYINQGFFKFLKTIDHYISYFKIIIFFLAFNF